MLTARPGAAETLTTTPQLASVTGNAGVALGLASAGGDDVGGADVGGGALATTDAEGGDAAPWQAATKAITTPTMSERWDL